MIVKLNAAQQTAATSLEGHLLIEAGAGSGKTRTLAERFANAVRPTAVPNREPASVREILVITFTDKAAGELAERIRATLRGAGCVREAREVDGAWISTIHGMCARLLRRHAIEAGLDPSFRVLEEPEAATLSERAFEEAAIEILGTPEGERLFATYDYDALFAATAVMAGQARAQDFSGAGAIRTPCADRDAASLLDEARRLFGAISAGLNERTGTAVCIADNREICRSLLSALFEMPQDLDEAALAQEVWRVLHVHRPARSAKAIADLREEMESTRERLLRESALMIARPLASTLIDLARDFGRRYSKAKANAGVLDFEDLQTLVARLFDTDPELAHRYAAQFRLVMVDEFQDTDELQTSIVRSLAPGNLCTVGDERQSIYRFRGADIDVFRSHARDLRERGATVLPLDLNYRSHPDILDFVNGMFSRDEMFSEHFIRLRPGRDEADVPVVPAETPRLRVLLADRRGRTAEHHERALRAEASAVARTLAELRDRHDMQPGDMAVLLRTYGHAQEFADALRRHDLPALVVGGRRFFDASEVEMVRAFCRLLANPADDEAFVATAISDMSELDDDALFRLAERRAGCGGSLWAALVGSSHQEAFPFSSFVGLVERARSRVGAMPLSEVLLRAIEESDTDLVLLDGTNASAQRLANVLKVARMADAFEMAGGVGPGEFTTHLDAKERSGAHETPAPLSETGASAVSVMSIHAAKGLEFPVVAVAQLGALAPSSRGIVRWARQPDGLEVALRLPSSMSPGRPEDGCPERWRIFDDAHKQDEAEEAKRLLYVACTRAKELLVLAGTANLSRAAEDVSGAIGQVVRSLGGNVPTEQGESTTRELFAGVRVSISVIDDEDSATADHRLRRPVDSFRSARVPVAAPGGDRAAHALPREPEPPKRLSYSDIEVYERCPLRYWAEGVARVGTSPRDDAERARAFGQALHSALDAVGPSGERLEDVLLARIARFHGLDPSVTIRLEEAVRRQAGSPVAAEAAAQQSVRAEYPFVLRLRTESDSFVLVGAMDVYARTDTAGLIVDYKSGRQTDRCPESQERQARYYALVALRDGCERVRVVFSYPCDLDERGVPKTAEYEFVASDSESIETEIVDIRTRMTQNAFAPLAMRNDTCADCPAAGVCPAAGGSS